jgi:putative heme transporter
VSDQAHTTPGLRVPILGEEPREPQLTPARILLGLLIALIVGVVVVVGIGNLAGFSRLTDVLRDGDIGWLAVCAVGQVVVFAGYAGALRRAIAFEGGPRIETGLSLRVVLASFALSQLFAAGGVAGLAVTYWALRRVGMARRDAAIRLIGLSTAVYFVFALIGWTAALLALVLGRAPLGMTLPWLIAVPLVLLAAYWFTDVGRVERSAAPGGSIVRQALSTGISAAWWVRRAACDRAEGRPVLGWALLYWAGDIASLWAALFAFEGNPGLIALTLVYTTGYLAQSVPIPFVATGGMDAATTFALTAVGIPLEIALVAVIAHRVFAFWIPLVPGLVFAALLPRTGNALEAAATSGAAGKAPLAPRAGNP